MPDLRLRKTEIIRTKTEIDKIFSEGRAGGTRPLRYVKTITAAAPVDTAPTKILFAAPKKNLRKAWMRNTVKRRMREAYRLHRHRLAEKAAAENLVVRIALIYSATDIADYKTIENALRKILDKIAESL